MGSGPRPRPDWRACPGRPVADTVYTDALAPSTQWLVRAGLVDAKAEVSVADTGVGIAPEDQEAVFEEFRQVGTAAKKVEGTGLGLSLARKFIELHGGRIWVTSQLGVGSTFTFTLPLRDAGPIPG